MLTVDELLAGPRGRRLCWELQRGPDSVLAAFADSVAWARYWQAPDDVDQRLAEPGAAGQLRPTAADLVRDPEAQWWSEPMDPADQHFVHFADTPEFEVASAAKLDGWHAQLLQTERDAPDFDHSGWWWSSPIMSGSPVTARSRDGIPVRLYLVEDESGWTTADTFRCTVCEPVRVYEITDDTAWIDLVMRYPVTVTRSKRWDWSRATGRTGDWLMPDYQAMARDYDAVHLTAAGYLQSAGRALPTTNGYTVLAGWDPDLTFWLTDVLAPTDARQSWRRVDTEWLRA